MSGSSLVKLDCNLVMSGCNLVRSENMTVKWVSNSEKLENNLDLWDCIVMRAKLVTFLKVQINR